jgi:hypothetical protein
VGRERSSWCVFTNKLARSSQRFGENMGCCGQHIFLHASDLNLPYIAPPACWAEMPTALPPHVYLQNVSQFEMQYISVHAGALLKVFPLSPTQ